MSFKVDVEIDFKGIAEVAKSPEVRQMVNDAAEKIAASVRGQVPDGVPVVVDHYTTDREAAAVTIADMKGVGLQAKHGVLTRAASGAGAEIRIR